MCNGEREDRGNLQLKCSEACENCAGIAVAQFVYLYSREDGNRLRTNQRGYHEFGVYAHRSVEERMISVGTRCKNGGRKQHTLVCAVATEDRGTQSRKTIGKPN